MSNVPNMLTHMGGVPVGGAKFSSPWATHYFVDGVDGTAGGSGLTPGDAINTIQGAVDLAEANDHVGVGDVIYIRPQTYVVGTGHARYTEAITVALTTSDLSVIGTGYPRSNEFGVRLRWTSGNIVTVNAPSTHWENIGAICGGADYTWNFQNNGATNTQRGSDGVTLYNCNSKGGPLLITGGQAARVINCVFNNADNELILATPAVSGYNQQVRGCAFLDTAQETAPTHPQISASGANVIELWIDQCFFGLIPTTTAYYIECAVNSTGMITGSYFNTTNLDTDTDISIAASSFAVVGSYDKTGLIDDTND
jgi:hypothetical protein